MDFQRLRKDLAWLRGEDGVIEESRADEVLGRILTPLLSLEGFDVLTRSAGRDGGLDFTASSREKETRAVATIGIQYKHFGQGRPIGVDSVRELIGTGLLSPHDRLMLIGRFGFTRAAMDAARRIEPVSVDLLDLGDMDRWCVFRRCEWNIPTM